MKKVLFTVATVCLFSITSCTTDSIEDIQQQELNQTDLYAKVDTGKDDSTNSGSDDDTTPDNGEE
ncbi:MAG: hypothetical protein HRT69_10575 [Flavobacteriaceae bacterium]|nr:hypothetical protein [Flavobacteriaceae bacterium]